MTENKPEDQNSHPQRRLSRYARRAGLLLLVGLVAYFLVAYIALPAIWRGYESRHPAMGDAMAVTETGDHHPGDPINIALVGSEDDVQRAMRTAGWKIADALGLESDASIAIDTVLRRPYASAPVSNLYYWGRKEDLAFELPAANDPSKRHHVRFWKSAELDAQGRAMWAGAATYDKSVGLSHTTGQITHHIDGNVDVERGHLLSTLEDAKCVASVQWIDNFHPVREGKNGGGDKWHTDGRLVQVELTSDMPTAQKQSR